MKIYANGKVTRVPVSLPSPRWTKYALGSAASALAGVGAGVTPVEAEIHDSGLVKEVVYATQTRSTQQAFLPLTGGASLSFAHGLATSREGAAFFGLRGAAVESVRGTGDPFLGQASKLHRGYNVSSGPFVGGSNVELFLIFHDDRGNPWARPGFGFVGFKFDVGNGIQYGWARLRMTGAPENGFIVVEYAWADPGERIEVGQTRANGGEGNAVSPSGSLGLLALGAAGLEAWRDQRRAAFTR